MNAVANMADNLAGWANDQILSIWYRSDLHLARLQPRMPMLYPEMSTDGLVVVSLNPSFSAKAFRQFLRGTQWESLDVETFFSWRARREEYDVATATQVEKLALDRYPFFRPFRRLAAAMEMPLQHVDLFLVRATKDAEGLELVGGVKDSDSMFRDLNPFGVAQVELCVELIGRLRPRAVVVPNVSAARILEERLGLVFDADVGHRWLPVGGRRVPVFFSSMWTGARAMDRYSKELLVWHIQKAVAGSRLDASKTSRIASES